MLKDTKFREILQGSAFGYQVFQLLRYGSIILAAIALSWIDPSKAIITQYEALLLLSSSFSFFWVSGLLDGFLVISKSLPLADRPAFEQSVKGWMLLLSLIAATGVALVLAIQGGGLTQISLAFASLVALDTACLSIPYILLSRSKQKKLILYAILSAGIHLLALLLPIQLGYALEWAFWALAIGAGLKLSLFFIPGGFFPGIGGHRGKYLGQLAKVSLPLMVAALLSQSAVYVDGYLVLEFFPSLFADFKYGARELPFILLLANSLSLVKSGELADQGSERRAVLEGLKKSAARLAWWGFGSSLLLMVFSNWIFAHVFNHNFAEAVPIFDIYLLLAIPRLIFPQSIVKGMQKTIVLSISAGIELALNLALSLIFLHFWGMPGIAMATVLAFCLEKLVLVAYLAVKEKLSISDYTQIFPWIVGSLALVATFLAKYCWLG